MAQDIVSGLFGLQPWEIQQQRNQAIDQSAQQYAQMQPLQRAAYGMYKAGAGLGGMLGGAMGMENPEVEQAKMREQALSGIDPSDPKSLLERAQQIQDPQLKMRLVMAARDAQAKQQQSMLALRKDTREQEDLDFKRKEAFELKKMEAEARIRQNDERIALASTTAAEKIALQRESNQIRLMLGQMANSIAQQRLTNAAEGKKDKATEKTEAAKEGLSSTLDSLQSAYDALNMEGGLPSKKRNALSNIGSYSASTGIGQTMGRMIGSKEQSYRDIINSSRMMLLNDIKNASGMTAQQMNSNVELQNWLNALGDPTVGYETATEIISNIRKKFIDGKGKEPAGSTGGWAIRPKGRQ